MRRRYVGAFVLKMFNPAKTAIKRKNPSAPARYVSKYIIPTYNPQSILDWGCGYGADIDWYRYHLKRSFTIYNDYVISSCAQGHDPDPKFGFTDKPDRCFDLITCTYVLNVLSDYSSVIDELLFYLNSNGKVFFTARSKNAVDASARKGKWIPHRFAKLSLRRSIQDNDLSSFTNIDGWISSKSKNTFQGGLTHKDYEDIAKEFNLRILPITGYKISGAVSALMERK